MTPFPTLDPHFPPRGACAICGCDDARHRLWDTIMARHDMGQSVAMIADDYGLTPEAVQAVLTVRPYKEAA